MLYNFQKFITINLDVTNYILLSLSDNLNHQLLLVFLSFIIWKTNFSINENLVQK